MKRLLASTLALGLALFPALGRAEDVGNPFWWDVKDRDITTISSGTGGTPQDTLLLPQTKHIGSFYEWEGYTEEQYFAMEDVVWEWEKQVNAEEWEIRHREESTVDGRIQQIVLWNELPRGWDGTPAAWRMRVAILDVDTFQFLSLSDLFYDGFNYIQYINQQAALFLFSDPWKSEEYIPITEEMQRRPFSGFPKNYPHFRIAVGENGGRVLELLVSHENPLFVFEEELRYPAIQIPLTDTVSPYGAPWANITVDPTDLDIHVARVSLPQEKNPQIAKKINAGMEETRQKALAHPMVEMGTEALPTLIPRVYMAGPYISTCYYGSESYKEGDQATIAAETFSMETGEIIDARPFWQAAMERLNRGDLSQEEWDDTLGNGCLMFSMETTGIEESFYNWGRIPDDYEMPPEDQMLYIGCRVWGPTAGGENFTLFYFDPAANVEHKMQISEALLKEWGLLQ